MLYHHFSRVSLYVCFIGMDGSVLVVIVYTGIASVTRKRDTVKSDSKLETAVLPTPQANSLYLFYYVGPSFCTFFKLVRDK